MPRDHQTHSVNYSKNDKIYILFVNIGPRRKKKFALPYVNHMLVSEKNVHVQASLAVLSVIGVGGDDEEASGR